MSFEGETDCAQKMAAAKTWFLAHSYTIKRDEPDRLVAGSLRAAVNIEHKPPTLDVLVVCLDTLGMLSITSGCEDIHTIKYDVIQAMNAASLPQSAGQQAGQAPAPQ